MRRSTTIYIFVLALLAGLYYFLNNRPKTVEVDTTAVPTAQTEYLFSPTDGLPTHILIKSKTGEIVELVRNEENAWALIQPEEAAADQSSVEAAASQVTTMQILEHVPDVLPETVGLNDPEYTISMQFSSGVERNTEIGVLTPTERGYYVRGEDGSMMIVSRNTVDSLLGLLINPPYVPTEVPAPATP